MEPSVPLARWDAGREVMEARTAFSRMASASRTASNPAGR
jgi:hypothetical protein